MQPETHRITGLVSTALSQRERSGILKMLRNVAESFKAGGCILWQVAPGADLKSAAPTGHLFVLGEWFHNHSGTAIHDLPLSSATGRSILTNTLFSGNVWDDSNGVFNIDPLFKQANIQIMCAIPIAFNTRTNGNAKIILGALNLYRNSAEDFTKAELEELKQVAQLVATLYQSVWDDIVFQLINKIDDVIHTAERKRPRVALSKKNVARVSKRVCELVTETLQCIEASVFLEDRLKSPGTYELLASTWPGKKLASAKNGTGLIGWVLQNAAPVRIFDLASFARDRLRFYDTAYPGITFTAADALDVQTIREILGLKRDFRLPKLSFLAVPIMEGQEVFGAIRCSIAKEGPFYFAERETELLRLVAAQLSRYWLNWSERRKLREEVQSWHAFAESVGKLDAFARLELEKDKPNESRIFEEALKDTEEIISGAEIMDVRLLDKKKRELYFVAPHGQAWHEGTEGEIQDRKNKTFPVDGPQTSAGARVFNSGQVEQLNNVHVDPDYSETFPNTKRMIIAPIRIGAEVYGVLDIRGTEDNEFPEHAMGVAKLLGERLGLYCLLVKIIRDIRDRDKNLEATIKKLDDTHKQQRHVLEDLNHQLYGPITDAHGMVNDILREEFAELVQKGSDEELMDRLLDSLLALRGQCGKTKRVTMSTGLFADLEIQEPDELKLARMRSKLKLKRMVREPRLDRKNPDDIYKKLVEAARDGHSLFERDREIKVRVRKDTFNVLIFHEVFVDYDMLEQAIVNLLDNAFKYSHPKTEIRIAGGLTHTRRFYITISSRGQPIKEKEIEKCKERGWRGEMAKHATGEGSGIGLWIVDYIMRAHYGELEITCNRIDDRTGITKIRLLFSQPKVEPIPKSDQYRFVSLES